ncbi:MAG: aspartate aminotransferase family protein, partial [Candidatus Omnitrophica bacterium]|nr:aspartate aminotransferase family protein [Candidatus Omnitrophota bacterium]
SPGPVRNYQEAKHSAIHKYTKFFHTMLQEGVYLPPSAYEALFLSASHGPKELKTTLEAASKAFKSL